MNKLALCGMLWLGLAGMAVAQAAKPEAPKTVTSVLDGALKTMEGEFVPAAEAMPEDKFDFAPTQGEFKGVRTFGQQVKHVAAVNFMVGAAILEEKPPADTGGESGPDSIKTKAQIVQYLKDSLAYAHKALASVNEKNQLGSIKVPWGGTSTRLGMGALLTSHGFDHYGQMAVYLRMNGIIPPASRK